MKISNHSTATGTSSASPSSEIIGPEESTVLHPIEDVPEEPLPDSTVDAIDGLDSPTAHRRIRVCEHRDDDLLLFELESYLRLSNERILSDTAALEESLRFLQREKDEGAKVNGDLKVMIRELSRQRDSLHDEIGRLEAAFKEKEERLDEELKEREDINGELEVCRERVEVFESEKKERDDFLLKSLDSIRPVKENLVSIVERLDDEEVIERVADFKLDQEARALWEEITALKTLASEAESRICEFKEFKNKEKKELENSVVSLTEENRDINSLLRIALVEKEAVEKTLNRLKGNSEQQKRAALLQIDERRLQRVGFGFRMGSSGSNEQSPDSLAVIAVPARNKSDSSDCEVEVVSLASTVERIMKKLLLEITQLRRSLDESRSATDRLQRFAEKQASTIEENMVYIKEQEDRESVLAQNVEELLMEIKATEEDVARWREACELEVEAGNNEVEDREKLVEILKKELEKMKAALDISNRKLKLKEELAAAAMAAEAAAEKSMQLADSRAAGLHEQIEELTKQSEEAEKSKERNPRRKIRHMCWPWRALGFNRADNTTNTRAPNNNVRRMMLPEMQALLQSSV